jgi:hypothetical protein
MCLGGSAVKWFKYFCVAGLALLVSPNVYGYGGEDMLRGKPWHHRDISDRALAGDDFYKPDVKFAGGARSISWHADFIDSYLYNPLFWGQGVFESSAKDRTKAALVGFKDLAKLHFDDTFSNAGIQGNWERYAAGTLAGLYWASEQGPNGDVAAGHHILGVSFHAVQDFYSHSNWETNTDNRCKTYFQTPKSVRNQLYLYSGAYEKALSGAPAHHGGYSLSCSLLRGEKLDPFVSTLCAGFSPLQNTGMCQKWRGCKGAVSVGVSAANFSNSSLVYLNPPGIALDNTWLSRVQAPNRGLTNKSGAFLPMRDGLHFPAERCEAIVASELGNVCLLDADQVFAGGKDVAIRASMEWAEWLEEAMIAMGKGAYWQRLKSEGSSPPQRYAQFEDFSKLPYQFLAAGPYPTANPSNPNQQAAGSSNGWYLRLRIKTATNLGAGTDSNIYARVTVNGRTQDILLDYLPTSEKTGRVTNRLLVYNDFESGDDDAYTIGPFAQRPEAIALYNDSAGAGDLLDALAEDFTNGVDEAITDAGRFLKSFIGGNADFVGSKKTSYTMVGLEQKFGRGSSFEDRLEVRGGSEGDHDVFFKVRDVPGKLTEQERQDDWRAVEIRLDRLKTINESDVDRGSNSDEPFVIFHIAPLNGRSDASYTYLSPAFEDMDDGETAAFPTGRRGAVFTAKIPPEGVIVISTAIYESDDETMSDRRSLRDGFISGLDEETRRPAAEFGDALGRAIAADWDVDSIEVFAFERGAYPHAGTVLTKRRVGEVEGDEVSQIWTLDWSRQKALIGPGVTPILSWQGEPPSGREVLEGVWHSNKYTCGAGQAYQSIEITASGEAGNTISAIKTQADGDECVGAGEETFRGEFANGRLTGERYIVPPPYDRPIEVTDPPDRLDVMPNYGDPSIHPQIGAEGNWLIQWIGSDSPPAFATLNKGSGWSCVYFPNGGCWAQFTRDLKAGWAVNAWRTDDVRTGSGEMAVSAGGNVTIKWNYYQLGNWGGASALAISAPDSISGSWKYGDDNNGAEIWVRVKGEVQSVGRVTEAGEVIKAVGDAVVFDTNYAGHGNNMRGNRDSIYIRLYGDNLWGMHRMFLPRSSDLELYSMRYICQAGEYTTHSNWMVCMSQGGVRGVQIEINIWPQAESKQHVLYFDGQEIPFFLNVINEPQRYPEWQPMKMDMASCSVLQEVGRPYDDNPFQLIRQDFRRQ